MKKLALIAAGLMAMPVTAGAAAMEQGSDSGTDGRRAAVSNATRAVVLQAGSTRAVKLSRVSAGTGYSWKWVTRPSTRIAKAGTPRAQKAPKGAAPGSPVWWQVGVLGLAEDQKTSGVVGLYAPGATSPASTITLRITVTGDGR